MDDEFAEATAIVIAGIVAKGKLKMNKFLAVIVCVAAAWRNEDGYINHK